MFERIVSASFGVRTAGEPVNIEMMLPDGENLAASLLVAGVGPFRQTPVSGAPRAPFCMMGACFDSLLKIDGVHRQACMLTVTEGMVITRPKGTTHG